MGKPHLGNYRGQLAVGVGAGTRRLTRRRGRCGRSPVLPCAPLPLPLLLLVLLRGAVLAACLLRAGAGAVAAAARGRGGGLPAIPRTTAVLLGALR